MGRDRQRKVEIFQHAFQQQAHGAKLGNGEKLIGVGGKCNVAPRGHTFRRDGVPAGRSQVFHERGERSGKLLGFRGAARVPDATVGAQHTAIDAAIVECAR